MGDCADDTVKTLSINESMDTFIQDLYCLAENCEYGTLKVELIRDRIIVRVLDDTLSDCLPA